jgi:hypothetical protein
VSLLVGKRMSMRRSLFVVLSLTAFALVAARPAAASPLLKIGPSTPATPTFSVPIEISGAADLVAWQFDLTFDPSDLQAISVSEGPFTSGSGLFTTLFVPGIIDNFNGSISLVAGAYLDLAPGPSGDGILALVDFAVLGDGSSTIELRNTSVIQNGEPSSGTTPVPEPATLMLVGGGLAAVARMRSRWTTTTSGRRTA